MSLLQVEPSQIDPSDFIFAPEATTDAWPTRSKRGLDLPTAPSGSNHYAASELLLQAMAGFAPQTAAPLLSEPHYPQHGLLAPAANLASTQLISHDCCLA